MGAVRASVDYTLAQAAASPLLRAMLVTHREPSVGPRVPETAAGALPLLDIGALITGPDEALAA